MTSTTNTHDEIYTLVKSLGATFTIDRNLFTQGNLKGSFFRINSTFEVDDEEEVQNDVSYFSFLDTYNHGEWTILETIEQIQAWAASRSKIKVFQRLSNLGIYKKGMLFYEDRIQEPKNRDIWIDRDLMLSTLIDGEIHTISYSNYQKLTGENITNIFKELEPINIKDCPLYPYWLSKVSTAKLKIDQALQEKIEEIKDILGYPKYEELEKILQ